MKEIALGQWVSRLTCCASGVVCFLAPALVFRCKKGLIRRCRTKMCSWISVSAGLVRHPESGANTSRRCQCASSTDECVTPGSLSKWNCFQPRFSRGGCMRSAFGEVACSTSVMLRRVPRPVNKTKVTWMAKVESQEPKTLHLRQTRLAERLVFCWRQGRPSGRADA